MNIGGHESKSQLRQGNTGIKIEKREEAGENTDARTSSLDANIKNNTAG